MILSAMKRAAVILLVLFLLTACGSLPETTETTAAAETVAETVMAVETVETTVETEPTLPPIVYETGELHGTEVFFCNDTAFPVGLGYPQLSDEQIDALIAETDYAKIAETINTLPDAVNFCKRRGFGLYPGAVAAFYGGLHHSESAWQVLERGSCLWRGFGLLDPLSAERRL